MQNKIKIFLMFVVAGIIAVPISGYADDTNALVDEVTIDATVTDTDIDADMESVNADAVAAYDMNGSLFQQITTLEQEKVLMELEKERAQLDLELDRLAAEKIKLHMEIDTLSGRAEQQQQELENAQAELEAEAARLAREKEELVAQTEELKADSAKKSSSSATTEKAESDNTINFGEKYRLINVIGAGAQLQATIEDLNTGQNKTISVGRTVDGYTVKSISLDEGVVFTNGTDTQMLNVTKSK